MSVASENRWKAKLHREAAEDERRRHDTLMAGESREARAELPPQPRTIATRAEIRRWLRANAIDYDGPTELAEGVNAALELPPGALDEGTHWIWDDALTAWEREHE